MTTRFRRQMLVLGTTILVMQAVFMPVGMVYAETTMDTEEQELVELTPMKNDSEEELVKDIADKEAENYFSFSQSHIEGVIAEPLQVTFSSNQEVVEVRVIVPEEAAIVKDDLPAGVSIKEEEQFNEWLVQSENAQSTFVLPIVFERIGSYELSIGEATITLEIVEQEEHIDEMYIKENAELDEINSNILNSADLIGTEKRIIFDGQGNIISGLLNYSYADKVVVQISEDSEYKQLGVVDGLPLMKLSSVGYFKGESVDLLIWGRLVNSFTLNKTNLSFATLNFSPSPTLSGTITVNIKAVSSETGELVNSRLVFPTSAHSRYTSQFQDFHVFRILNNQTSSFSVTYNEVSNLLSLTGSSAMNVYSLILENNSDYNVSYTATNVVNPLSFISNSGLQGIGVEGKVIVNHIDTFGNQVADSDTITGYFNQSYETESKEIDGYELVSFPENKTGFFWEDDIIVNYIYDLVKVNPVDPLDPEVEVDPENKPELPEDQGQLSIDFISSFNFGSQAISVQDKTYYAQPQRLLNEDGTVNEYEERPNYVQISDRRSENDRNGWQLAVTQRKQFEGQDDQQLTGASLSLSNQQLVTAQDGVPPSLQATNPLTLVPGNKRTLIRAEGAEGTGTWIYRFGDGETAGESVSLDVPRGANPEATTYSTTLIWELSAVPGN